VTASEGNRIKDCVLLPKSHKIINKGLTKAHGDLIWYQSKYPKFKFNLCYTPFRVKILNSNMRKLTKHTEQVRAISTLTESKSSQVSEGWPSSLHVRLHPSNKADALLDLTLLSLRLMWKAISSHSQGL
jgi:hypothetical protein